MIYTDGSEGWRVTVGVHDQLAGQGVYGVAGDAAAAGHDGLLGACTDGSEKKRVIYRRK